MHSAIAQATASRLERGRRFFINASALAVVSLIGTGASLALMPSAAVPMAFLTCVECLVAVCAYYRSVDLLQQLAVEPYALVQQTQRDRLAASIDSLISEAGSPGSCSLGDRIHLVEEQLRAISRELATPHVPVHWGSALICLQLLTSGVDSPLYNPNLTVEQLHATLLRIRYGIGRNIAA